MWKWIAGVCLCVSLSACNFFAPPAPEQTLAADHSLMGTQVAVARITATVAVDRLLVTQDAAQTAVREVDAEFGRINATVIALGTQAINPALVTPVPVVGAGGTPVATLLPITPGAVAQGSGSTAGSVPTPTLAPVAPVDPNAPALRNVVTAAQVGADDCAIGPTSTFSSTAAGVYVVATAFNLSPQNQVSYRWTLDGAEVWVDSWSPASTVNGACIWYYLTPDQVALTAGAWAVELAIDGAVIGPPSAFTITP
ncbi:MAG: hypothetical protein SF123_12465 [Chloroflexota bacterium]|nr:hypothetical protein [Chloroflexota bacterium]